MPLASLSGPIEIARANAVMDRAWRELEARGAISPERAVRQRERLAGYVAAFVIMIEDEDELVEKVVARFVDRM